MIISKPFKSSEQPVPRVRRTCVYSAIYDALDALSYGEVFTATFADASKAGSALQSIRTNISHMIQRGVIGDRRYKGYQRKEIVYFTLELNSKKGARHERNQKH